VKDRSDFAEAPVKNLILIHSNPTFLEVWEGLSDAERIEFGRRPPAPGRGGQRRWTRSPVCLRNCWVPAARQSAAARVSTASDDATRRAQPSSTRGRIASIA
jgi:hypothetical protein